MNNENQGLYKDVFRADVMEVIQKIKLIADGALRQRIFEFGKRKGSHIQYRNEKGRLYCGHDGLIFTNRFVLNNLTDEEYIKLHESDLLMNGFNTSGGRNKYAYFKCWEESPYRRESRAHWFLIGYH